MFRTEDLVQESKGKRSLHPVQERHTECDELSSYRSRVGGLRFRSYASRVALEALASQVKRWSVPFLRIWNPKLYGSTMFQTP